MTQTCFFFFFAFFFVLVQKVFHQRPVTSLCEQLCVFMLFLRLQLSLCLNPPMPCESGHSHQLGSALPVPSTLISEHRSLRCDQRSPPRIIYQLLWCSLPDVILLQRCKWFRFYKVGPSHCASRGNIQCIKVSYRVYP